MRVSCSAIICLFIGLLVSPATAGDTKRPNVVFILADDLGYGDLSSYGAPDIRTPNIDRIGAEGVRFTSFYANSSVCSPTRAALLTGRHPELVGMPGVTRSYLPSQDWGHLDPNAVLLPQILKEAGYDTALIGKWHLGLESPNIPTDRGFDVFRGWLRGMMGYYDHRFYGHNCMRDGADQIDTRGHATDLFTAWAVDYLHARVDDPDPFFLFLSYTAPHNPIEPPEDYLVRARKRISEMRENMPTNAASHWPLVFHEKMTEEDRLKLIGLVEHLDDSVGKVLAALENTGALDNTIVMFASDNGGLQSDGAWNGPVMRSGKGTMYEGGLKVALMARAPGLIKKGGVVSSQWSSIDIAPSLIDLVGEPVPERMDGVSFRATLRNAKRPAPERDLFFVRREGGVQKFFDEPDYVMRGGVMRAVRRGPWKLVLPSAFTAAELYNLDDDPGEANNVIDDHPEIADALGAALEAHIGEAGRVVWRRQDIWESQFPVGEDIWPPRGINELPLFEGGASVRRLDKDSLKEN